MCGEAEGKLEEDTELRDCRDTPWREDISEVRDNKKIRK